jgi:hypothetical protein
MKMDEKMTEGELGTVEELLVMIVSENELEGVLL